MHLLQRHLPQPPSVLATPYEPWAKARLENTCPKNWLWYRTEIRALTNYKPLARARLDEITGELATDFAARRMSDRTQVSTANNSLLVLRRILNLAVEWDVLATAPKIKTLPGERQRERVITPKGESAVSRLNARTLGRRCPSAGRHGHEARRVLSAAPGARNVD